MSTVFIEILNMSVTAGIAACAVMLLRLPLKNAPKIFSYALWAVVLFRLLCPFTFESAFSLMPANPHSFTQDFVYTQTQVAESNLTGDITANDIISPGQATPADNPIRAWIEAAAYVWAAGIFILLSYAFISYVRLKRGMETAVRVENNIYETDRISTPFVLGFIKPKIYLPAGTENFEYIIMHEQTHIRRRDHLIKPVAFFALALHWFNPVIWLSYFLMCKDMEMSCDESVLKNSGVDIRKNYSGSLLDLSVKQSGFLSPLAFGESNTKARVKNVLRYKKRALWISVAAVVAVLCAVAGFAVNRAGESDNNPVEQSESEILNGDLSDAGIAENRAGESGNNPVEQSTSGILNGNLSDFAGVWMNGNGETRTLNPDGTIGTAEEFSTDGITYHYTADSFTRHEDGHYTWGVGIEDYDAPNGFAVWFYPVGVEVYVNNELFPTDTTQPRLYSGHDFMPDMTGEIFYPLG